jgi:WD40 repeat protein
MLYFIRTHFEARKVLFSENDDWLVVLGKDGCIRMIDWKMPPSSIKIEHESVSDAISSRNGHYFAISSEDEVIIYDSLTMKSIGSFKS